eukprot:scaffold2456_cov171-Skeletonema_dohrnii-CCMP3373.AAC.3
MRRDALGVDHPSLPVLLNMMGSVQVKRGLSYLSHIRATESENVGVAAIEVDISTTVWLLLMVIVQIPLSWIRDIRRLTVTNLLANVLILFGLLSCLGLAMRQMGESGSVGDESTSFLEEMVYRAKSLPAFNPDGWFLFLGTSVLLFEGSITLLVPLIEAVNTSRTSKSFRPCTGQSSLGLYRSMLSLGQFVGWQSEIVYAQS